MTAAVLTPFTAGEAVELGNRLWRKKVLPVGDVQYKDRVLKFTRDYLGRLVQAFTDRAYDQVPFQLAPGDNSHSNDPERTRGEITAMDLGDDGLYVTAQVNEAGEKVLKDNPRLGVSARIVEGYDRSDGRHFDAAVQHILGTLDPRIPGLGAWEAIEAASPEPDWVIDMSGGSFTDLSGARQTDPAGGDAGPDLEGAVMADLGNLTGEQQARLVKLLDLPDGTLDALAAGGLVITPEELDALTTPDADGGDGGEDGLAAEIDAMTDDELAALEAELDAEYGTGTEGGTPDHQPEGEPVPAQLSAEAQFSIDMANARTEETARELAVVTARLREEDFLAEKRRMADMGVPPYITELARPLLEGAGHAVELSNGNTVDAGAIMRRVLSEYARQARLLDLDVELGSPMDEPEEAAGEQQAQSRGDLVSRFKTVTGL